MNLFYENLSKNAPLAERMRPRNLDEFVGQSHLAKKGSLLRRAIEVDRLGSCIFFGPPGTGKTTLASIVANTTGSEFRILNAVTSGVADAKKVIECTTGRNLSLDTDIFYDMLSAFCKSLRGSDADAALYWSRRMIKAGIDPLIIARRLIAHSSEDVGLANSQALVVSVSAMQAVKEMGIPEGLIPLSHAIIYVCMSPKSNSVITAMGKADEDVEKTFNGAVPDHLKNYNYANEKREKYKYPHEYGGYVEQQYLPTEIKDHVYYVPSQNGSEKSIVLPESKKRHIK